MKINGCMLLEENRLATFRSWVFDDDKPCSAARMAQAGFYFTGSKDEPDLVNCFLCDKALDGWEPDDDPWMEHIKHSKQCFFAQMQIPQYELMYQQFAELEKNYKLALLDRRYAKVKEYLTQVFEEIKKSSPTKNAASTNARKH